MEKKEQEIINLYNKYGLELLEEFKGMYFGLIFIDSFGYKYKITPYNLSNRKSFNITSSSFR